MSPGFRSGWMRGLLVMLALVMAGWPTDRQGAGAAEEGRDGGGGTVRTWTDVDGREITARAVRLEDRVLILEVGGREFRVPEDRLSSNDRRWLMRNRGQVPRLSVVAPEDLSAADEATLRRMIRVPGEPQREWQLGPGRTLAGRLIGVAERTAVIQPTGRDGALALDRLRLRGEDHRYMSRVRPPEGELVDFPGEGAAARELAAKGLVGYEYRLERFRVNPAPAGVRSSVRFRWFTPELEAGRQYPLVLFLHGIGELGEDNVRQLEHRDPLMLVAPANQRRYPCFFMAPQHGAGENWGGGGSFHGPNEVLAATLEALRYMQLVEHAGQVDWRRIYVTGLSSGGHGAYAAISLYPEWFAAAVPVAASTNPVRFRRDNARPMWVFYNRGDSPRLAHNIGLMERHLRELGQPLRVTVFDGGGHNAWREAYDHGGLARWLFDQQQPLR